MVIWLTRIRTPFLSRPLPCLVMRFFKKTLTIADTRDEEKSRPVSKTPILRPRGVCCDEGTDLTKEMVKSDGEQFCPVPTHEIQQKRKHHHKHFLLLWRC